MPEPSDYELMDRLRGGEEEALRLLVERHQGALVNFFRRLGAQQDGDDLAQETFLRVYRYRHRYERKAKFTTFLYTLARHAWVDAWRRRARLARVRDRLQNDPCAARGPRLPPGAGLDVRAALATLPEKLRMTLVLVYYQGLGYEEVARTLGIPAGTVKSRVFLAMARLKEMLL